MSHVVLLIIQIASLLKSKVKPNPCQLSISQIPPVQIRHGAARSRTRIPGKRVLLEKIPDLMFKGFAFSRLLLKFCRYKKFNEFS